MPDELGFNVVCRNLLNCFQGFGLAVGRDFAEELQHNFNEEETFEYVKEVLNDLALFQGLVPICAYSHIKV